MAVCEKCAQNLMSHSLTAGHGQTTHELRVYLDSVSLACYEAALDVAQHYRASSITTLHFVYAMAELSAAARILESWNISPAALSRDAAHALTSPSASGEGSATGARITMSDDLYQLFQVAMHQAKRDGARVASFKHLNDAFAQAAQFTRGDAGASLFLTHVTLAYRNRQHSVTAADRHQHQATSSLATASQATRFAATNTDTRARTSRHARDIHTQTFHQHTSTCSCRQTSHQLQLTTHELNGHINGLNARLAEQAGMLDRATRELQHLRRVVDTSSVHSDRTTRGAVANDDIQRLSCRLDDMAMLLTDIASSNRTRLGSGEDGTAASVNTTTAVRTKAASTGMSASGASARKSTSSASRSSSTSSDSATTHAARQSSTPSRTSSSRKAKSSSLRGGTRMRSRARTGTQRTRRRARANRHQNLFSRLRRGQRQRFLSRVRRKLRSHWGAKRNTGRGRGQSYGSGSGGGSGVGTPNPNYGNGYGSGTRSSAASGRGNGSRGSYELAPRDAYDRELRADRKPREDREPREPRQREQRPDLARNGYDRADRNRDDGEKEKRFYLDIDDDIVDGPSIGPKTAARLYRLRLNTVRDLLECDPDIIAEQIDARHITADVMRDWQDQARLVCVVPWLRGTHAQILVGAGFRDVAAIVAADNADIMSGVLAFATTSKGQSVLRSGEPPEMEKVLAWIEAASQAELQRAA